MQLTKQQHSIIQQFIKLYDKTSDAFKELGFMVAKEMKTNPKFHEDVHKAYPEIDEGILLGLARTKGRDSMKCLGQV